jgi:hypothetical protein
LPCHVYGFLYHYSLRCGHSMSHSVSLINTSRKLAKAFFSLPSYSAAATL